MRIPASLVTTLIKKYYIQPDKAKDADIEYIVDDDTLKGVDIIIKHKEVTNE